MKSRMLAHFEAMIALLIGLLTFGVMNVAQAVASDEFVISKDGVELAVRFEKTASPVGMQVKCKVSNRNQSDVHFQNTGPTMALAFIMLDSSDREITPKLPWSGFITSESILDTPGKRSRLVIKPNESVEFNLALNDAFGDDWRSGAKLFIEWIPGRDGAGNPLQTGKGLNTSFDLTGNQPRQSSVSSPVTQSSSQTVKNADTPKSMVLKKASETKPAPNSPNREPTSSTPWSILVVLIVVAIGLLWLLFKKRK